MSNRREFITLLGGAAAWPLAARAQRPERMRRIGLLMGAADNREGQARVTALKQGLQELGWTDGGNIQIETRFAGAGRPHTGSRSRTSSARARRNRRPNDAGHSGAAAGNKLQRQSTILSRKASFRAWRIRARLVDSSRSKSFFGTPAPSSQSVVRKPHNARSYGTLECSHSWARRGSCIAPGFLAPDKLHRKSLGERAVGEIVASTVTSAYLAYLQHQDVTVAQRVRWLSAAADGA